MNPSVSSKTSEFEEPKKVHANMPMKVHEMMGLPKSAGKSVERIRSEPVKIKFLLEAMGSCSKKTLNNSVAARRTTLASAATRNIRRQLYAEADDQMGSSQFINDTSINRANNASSSEKLQDTRLGLSKSDGKVKINEHRLQPVRVAQLLKSWEKSQTVKATGPKSSSGGFGNTNVRRKLYSTFPSPAPSPKVVKKILPPKKNQETATSNRPRNLVKPGGRKSTAPAISKRLSRKSCLLPPNSIRDMHITRKAKETIIEESPNAISPEISNITSSKTNVEETKLKIENVSEVPQIAAVAEIESSLRIESAVDASCQEDAKVCDAQIEIQRPSVIMGFTTSTATKNRLASDSSSKSSFEISRPPLQELNVNSTMPQQRLDANNTSLLDLLGNSDSDRQDLFKTSELPCNSFLKNWEDSEKSLAQVDKCTLSWLYENVNLCVQMTEESLFSMKKIQNTIGAILASNSSEIPPKASDCVAEEIPKVVVENCEEIEEKCEEKIAAVLPIPLLQNNIFQDDTENRDGNLSDQEEEDKENVATENDGKTRRRSARLEAIQTKKLDDSFSRIEAELNISHKKASLPTPRKTTPKIQNKVDPRSRKSIREYMALKSCSTILQTPDMKGVPTPKGDKTGTPSQRRAIARAISKQLLSQLDDLYAESP